jgi:hypothetical protein
MSIEKNWLELIRPKKPVIEHAYDASKRGTLIAEPLERGFGLTLGNLAAAFIFGCILDLVPVFHALLVTQE